MKNTTTTHNYFNDSFTQWTTKELYNYFPKAVILSPLKQHFNTITVAFGSTQELNTKKKLELIDFAIEQLKAMREVAEVL